MYKVAVVGATGSVGREMLAVMHEREFPARQVVALASRRSLGTEVSYGDSVLKTEALDHCDWSDIDICLMSAGGDVSREWAPKIARQGVIVIDNSSAWRMDSRVPLIVPEVNADAICGVSNFGIIANPNCATIALVVAIYPIHCSAGINRVVMSTYQSVSGAGNAGSDELFNQTKGIYSNQDAKATKFPKQIAFNVIPHIDKFLEDGTTGEEWKIICETKKIVDAKIRVSATAVRVPVFVGHSLSVNLELEQSLPADAARALLRQSPGILVVDDPRNDGYITPVDCAGEYATFISRIRDDVSIDNGLNMWVVSDNLRKGAALNAVQIAEVAISRKLIQRKDREAISG